MSTGLVPWTSIPLCGGANAPPCVVVEKVEVLAVVLTPALAPGLVPDFKVDYSVGLIVYGVIRSGAYTPFASSRNAVTLSLAYCSLGGNDCSLADDADLR